MHIHIRQGLVASDQVAATIFAVEMAELVEQTTVTRSVSGAASTACRWARSHGRARWPVSSTPLRKARSWLRRTSG